MKLCYNCKLTKPFVDFHKNKSRPDGLQTYCKTCARQLFGKWQKKTPGAQARHGEWKKLRTAENRKLMIDYLADKTCADCPESDFRVLDFDHVSGTKVAGVMTLVARGATWENILAEIVKCEIRCVKCHRLVTAQRGNWWWTLKN